MMTALGLKYTYPVNYLTQVPTKRQRAALACRNQGHVWPSGLKAEDFLKAEHAPETCPRCGITREVKG